MGAWYSTAAKSRNAKFVAVALPYLDATGSMWMIVAQVRDPVNDMHFLRLNATFPSTEA